MGVGKVLVSGMIFYAPPTPTLPTKGEGEGSRVVNSDIILFDVSYLLTELVYGGF